MSEKTTLQKHIWRDTWIRIIPLLVAAVLGAVICDTHGNIRSGDMSDKFFAVIGVSLFVLASVALIQTLSQAALLFISAHPARRLNKGRAGALRFLLRLIGYIIIGLATLQMLGFSVANLLIGGAALGVVLGVAAQQSLANFFAGIVLIITHPFSIGDKLRFNSGALGGKYEGTVYDIGLTHIRLKLENEELVLFPNATILSGATITFSQPKK